MDDQLKVSAAIAAVAALSDGVVPPVETTDEKHPDHWRLTPVSFKPKYFAGKNDSCPCGSGLKFKNCCRGKPCEVTEDIVSNNSSTNR